MTRRHSSDLRHSDVTPQAMFLNRRALMAGGVGAMAGFPAFSKISAKPSAYSTTEKPTAAEDIKNYCNFYEFGTGKGDPAEYAHTLTTDPWSVEIGGLVDRPGSYGLGDILSKMTLEERIYRFRCVEAWSMVVPWIGFQMSDLLKLAGVGSGAKYVAFETLYRPEEMWAQKRAILNWPYVEGLRLDEAMNPLTIMATGLYGEEMPKQNGAPIRLVVPWKYGFKSIKSIVKITLTDIQPPTTWNTLGPSEYGFYSNVNPEVDHPRWSQATERVIGSGLFGKKKETRMFNGYEKEVAALYKGMDLAKQY